MNQTQATIWKNLETFDLDQPLSEYSFSIRLASENGWSQSFAQRAIVEYKKFMFLATISTEMVSPSHIVDVVWHQHLIFTQSYNKLCGLTGKVIQHIPSLHHNNERDKFNSAKNRSMELYRDFFGEPPKDIWFEKEFLPALNAPAMRASVYYMNYQAAFLMLSVVLYYPISAVLRPILIEIDNPYFLMYYWCGFFALVFALLTVRTLVFKSFVAKLYRQGTLQNLSAFELIYLAKRRLADIVHGIMNELLKYNRVTVESDNQIKQIVHSRSATNQYEYAVLQSLEERGTLTHYPALLGVVVQKPIFKQTSDFMNKVLDSLLASKTYASMAVVEFLLIAMWVLAGFVRMNLGIEHEKPVLFLVLSLVAIVLISFFLLGTSRRKALCSSIIALYKQQVEAKKPDVQEENAWEWQYFLLGNAVLASSFTPLVTHIERKNEYDGGSSSCGSSCSSGDGGSGCGGGGCGGCGGGGD